MKNLLFSFLILLVFFTNGYWLYTLLGQTYKKAINAFLISTWFGLLTLLLVSLTLYKISASLPAQNFSIPLLSLFSVASLIALIYSWKKPEKSVWNMDALWIGLISLIALFLISSPFLEKMGLTFYYSNNGEFLSYAMHANVVQHHGYDTGSYFPGQPSTHLRETAIGILCALFSTLFIKSSFFLIQPLSYSLTLLAFLSFGAILLQLKSFFKDKRWSSYVIFTIYLGALFSAANLQFWTHSFMSNYLNQVIILGWILFYTLSLRHRPSFDLSRNTLALGLTLAASACAYPEQIVPTTGALCFISLFLCLTMDIRSIMIRLISLAGSFVTALIAGNAFLISTLKQYVFYLKGIAFSKNTTGWDIYGSSLHPKTLFNNLFGLTNLFWGKKALLAHIPFYCLIILLVLGTLQTIRLLISKKITHKITCIPWLFLGYLAASTFFLCWTFYQCYSTNYPAVKFIISWIWILYVGLAYAFGTFESIHWRRAITILALPVLIATFMQAFQFSRGLRLDALSARYTETDVKQVKQILNGSLPLVLSPKTFGFFPLTGILIIADDQDVLSLLKTKKEAFLLSEAETLAFLTGDPFKNHAFILTIGPAHHFVLQDHPLLNKAFHSVYSTDGLTLFHQKKLP